MVCTMFETIVRCASPDRLMELANITVHVPTLDDHNIVFPKLLRIYAWYYYS
jgi:hypothetical protein